MVDFYLLIKSVFNPGNEVESGGLCRSTRVLLQDQETLYRVCFGRPESEERIPLSSFSTIFFVRSYLVDNPGNNRGPLKTRVFLV